MEIKIIYYAAAIIAVAGGVIASVGGIVAYVVRKLDKVKDISGKIINVDINSERISANEQRLDLLESNINIAFERIDQIRTEQKLIIEQMKLHFDEVKGTNSLILKAVQGLVDAGLSEAGKNTLSKVKKMLDDKTVVTTRA